MNIMPGSIHFIGWNLSVKYIKFTNIPITIISDKKNHDSYAKVNGTAYTIKALNIAKKVYLKILDRVILKYIIKKIGAQQSPNLILIN
tara:strand:+ start:421 stop:684 length:264 start_codon:yes stop_codon:yes gene_type:complete